WLAGEMGPQEFTARAGSGPSPYLPPSRRGDLATLRCLRRLGWPLGAALFTEAVRGGSPLGVLGWLLQEGCPVDWEGAMTAASGSSEEVKAWLREQRGREGEERGKKEEKKEDRLEEELEGLWRA
ncbi:hypothetical protein Agub_g5770, partial [Astrephomene gubernaculifera]